MRAVVFENPGKISIEERNAPEPGYKEVLIETAAVGICGTDVHVFDGDFAGSAYPIIPGHEISGTIVALGEGAEDSINTLAVGDHVVVDPGSYCGECTACRNGHKNLCPRWAGMGVTTADGAVRGLFTAPVASTYTLKPETDLHLAALIEPLACAIRGWDILPRRMGDHVLVYGAGTMGLLMAQLATRGGAATVSIVDLNEERLKTAEECGIANRYTDADQAGRDGWDVVIDATGNVRAIEDALGRVNPAGYFQDFGVAPSEAIAKYSPFTTYRNEITIVGSMAVLNTFGRAVDMFEAGAINAKAMVSHSFTIDEYEVALDMFRKGQGRKLQIRPNDTESRVLIP